MKLFYIVHVLLPFLLKERFVESGKAVSFKGNENESKANGSSKAYGVLRRGRSSKDVKLVGKRTTSDKVRETTLGKFWKNRRGKGGEGPPGVVTTLDTTTAEESTVKGGKGGKGGKGPPSGESTLDTTTTVESTTGGDYTTTSGESTTTGEDYTTTSGESTTGGDYGDDKMLWLMEENEALRSELEFLYSKLSFAFAYAQHQYEAAEKAVSYFSEGLDIGYDGDGSTWDYFGGVGGYGGIGGYGYNGDGSTVYHSGGDGSNPAPAK